MPTSMPQSTSETIVAPISHPTPPQKLGAWSLFWTAFRVVTAAWIMIGVLALSLYIFDKTAINIELRIDINDSNETFFTRLGAILSTEAVLLVISAILCAIGAFAIKCFSLRKTKSAPKP